MIRILLLCLIGMTGLAQAQDAELIKGEIEKIITYDTETAALRIPHLMVGIVMNGKEYYFDFGHRSKAEPIDSSTLFEIGDLTKVFTALTALSLQEEGHLSVDSSWNYFLEEAYQRPEFEHASLKDLLQHQSGLSKLPEGIGAMETDEFGLFANYTSQNIYEYIQSLGSLNSTEFLYSNTGYALAELFLSKAMQVDFKSLLREKVARPYGMIHMDKFLRGDAEQQLQGFDLSDQAIASPTYSSFFGSLGLSASAADLLHFAKQSFTNPNSAYRKSLNEFITIDKKSRLEIGYGWHRLVDKKHPDIYLHTGKTNGFRSYLGMVPETKTAVVVLSNSKLPQNGLGYYILKMINFGWKKPKGKKKKG